MSENDSFDDAFAALAAAMDVATAEGAARTPEEAVAAVQAADDAAPAAPVTPEPPAAPEPNEPEPPVVPEVPPVVVPPAPPVVVTPPPVVEPPAETPEQKVAREKFETSITPYEPSEAEAAALVQFEKDFPNEFAAMQARLKAVDRDINARVYQAVQNLLQHVDGRIAPVERATTDISYDRHMAALHAAHPDYDAVVTSLPQWIKTQPALFQPALQAAYDKGSTQDVIDLVAAYKKDAGTPAIETPPAAPAAKPKPNDAADLAPVTQRRTTPNPKGTKDPNNFDEGWSDAAELYATK